MPGPPSSHSEDFELIYKPKAVKNASNNTGGDLVIVGFTTDGECKVVFEGEEPDYPPAIAASTSSVTDGNQTLSKVTAPCSFIAPRLPRQLRENSTVKDVVSSVNSAKAETGAETAASTATSTAVTSATTPSQVPLDAAKNLMPCAWPNEDDGLEDDETADI